MTKRIQKLMMAVAALGALALGGGALAQAQSSPASATGSERVTAPDRDNVQSGDQTTPDTRARQAAKHKTVVVRGTNAQSGSQTAPDTGTASEPTGAETPEQGAGSESASNGDGPGGHADAPGANADHQFQGTE